MIQDLSGVSNNNSRMRAKAKVFILLSAVVVLMLCNFWIQFKEQDHQEYLKLAHDKEIIIIVSYLRAGSSIVSQLLLGADQEPFYVFEPFKFVTDEQKSKVLSRILNCTTGKLNGWDKWEMVANGDRSGTYIYGHYDGRTGAYHDRNGTRITSSPEEINKLCDKSSFIHVKIDRMDLRSVIESLKTLGMYTSSNMKVVLLVRDPRAIESSLQQIFWCKDPDSECSVEPACTRMSQDYNAMNEFKTKFPSQLFLIRYEDMMSNASVLFPQMFQKLHPSKVVSEDYHRLIGFHTNESYKYINKWIQQLPRSDIERVEKICSDAMSYFGYVKFDGLNTT